MVSWVYSFRNYRERLSMYTRLIALILTVVFTASSLAGTVVLAADCMDHPCCCHSPAMAGHTQMTTMIRSVNGCCCQQAGEMPCTLTKALPSENNSWAVLPKRPQAPFPNISDPVSTVGILDTFAISFAPTLTRQAISSGSPPIYRSTMSFLC